MTPVKRYAIRFCMLAILILGAGCTGDQESAGETPDEYGDPVSGGTAVIATGADMTIPLLVVAQGTLDGNLGADVMYMSLLRGAWRDGRIAYMTAEESPMAIARSWEYVGADSAGIRFHMRSDLRWSDGEPLTASDVQYTYSIIGDPDLASPVQDYAEFIEAVEAENDSTVVFHYTRRQPEMLTHAALPIIPEHTFGDTPNSEFRNNPAARNPENGNLPVSGPFMIGNWERGTRIELVRNPEFQPAARLDQIVLRIIPDPMTRQIELQTGGVDMVQTLTLDQLPMLQRQAPNVRYEVEEKRYYDFVIYNGGQFEPFADPEIRRALTLATDRQGILTALQLSDYAQVAGGPYPPIFADVYDAEAQAPLPFDRDEARSILASKGWSDEDGDGTLEKDGQPFQFTLHLNVGSQRRADVAQILQQQWSQVGVEVDIQTIEFNTMNQNLLRGEFEAAIYGWSVSLSPDLTPIWAAGSPFNFSRYRNPAVDSLFTAARQQPTEEAATELWREAATHIVEDQPYTFLYFMDSVDGVNNRLRGLDVDTFGALQNTWEWWIPAELQR